MFVGIAMIIVIIVMMMVMVVMMIIEIDWWLRVKNQKCWNTFICSHTFHLLFHTSDSSVVIVIIVTVVAFIIPLYINTL